MAGSGGGGSARIGVYPGTFDPLTLGHADIIRRGAKLVDRLNIGVTTNISKNPMFTPDERITMVEREVAAMGIENAAVVGFNALLMKWHAALIIGIRFAYGLRIAGPIVIGMSSLAARRFLVFNAIGALIWAPSRSVT